MLKIYPIAFFTPQEILLSFQDLFLGYLDPTFSEKSAWQRLLLQTLQNSLRSGLCVNHEAPVAIKSAPMSNVGFL